MSHALPQRALGTVGRISLPRHRGLPGHPGGGQLGLPSPGWAFLGPAGCLASASLSCPTKQVLEHDRPRPGCPVHQGEQAGLQLQHEARPSG